MEMNLEIDSGLVQEIATDCVLKYTASGTSLSDSIAGKAKELRLNSEQIKRVIEATNTIAYLRLLKDSPERTFEFPVATFEEVMGKIVLPTSGGFSGEAPASAMTKQASAETVETEIEVGGPTSSPEELASYLVKKACTLFDQIQYLEVESCIKAESLVKAAQLVGKDPLGFEKLSTVVSDEEFKKLSALCGFTKSAEEKSYVFSNSEIGDAQKLAGLFKEACDFSRDLEDRKGQYERIMEKKAFLTSLGRGVGSVLGAPLKLGAKAISSAGTQASKGIDAMSSSVGRKLGMTPPPPANAKPKTIFGVRSSTWGKALTGTGVAAAASAPAITHKHDVWDSLQG